MKNLINKLKQFNGVQFVAINNYTNKQGEISKVLLNVGASIQNAKQKDINTLKGISYDYETIEEKARIELLTALTKPTKQTKNRSQGQKDAYVQLCTGIRMHIETKTISPRRLHASLFARKQIQISAFCSFYSVFQHG